MHQIKQKLTSLLLITGSTILSALASERPNILYIMADDHSANTIGAYSHQIKELDVSPNIDRLANEGALLTNCFCTNSLCAPSRTTIITGKYSHKSGVYTLREELNTHRMPTLAKLFQKADYQTAVIGKWHVDGDNLHGYDYYAVTTGQGSYENPSLSTKEGKINRQGYVSDVYTDISLEWLERRNKSEPFMLMVHHKATHSPWVYAERHKDLFADIDIPEPPTLFDDYENRDANGVPKTQARIHNPPSKSSLSRSW